MQWYYIDEANATKGPVSEGDLSKAYAKGTLNDNCFVWNGTTVNEWKYIRDVPGLSEKLRPKRKPKPAAVKPKPAPLRGAPEQKSSSAKSRPVASGNNEERNKLLASIQVGKKLKARPKNETVKKKSVGQMSLAEQMKEKLSKRNKNQPQRISKKKSRSLTNSPRKSKGKVNTKPRTTAVNIVNKGDRGSRSPLRVSRSSRGALPHNYKNKVTYIHDALDKLSAEDGWKILAIEKILK